MQINAQQKPSQSDFCEFVHDECIDINVKQPSKLHQKGGPFERSKCW